MTKRAFFVIGSEGSGTNMLAEAFVSAGCHEDPRHRSYMDDYEFEKMPDLLMFRRSLPHAGEWPDLQGIRYSLKETGYKLYVLFIIRDWHCTIQSVLRRDSDRQAFEIEANIMRAFEMIGEQLYGFIGVSYESFCLHPEFRRWLFVDRLGLKEPTIEIKYANLKYYGG